VKSLLLLQNWHASSAGFNYLVGSWDFTERALTHIASEEVDGLHSTVLQGDVSGVKVIGLTFRVCVTIGVGHNLPFFLSGLPKRIIFITN
jgi:hypothetical protein